MTFMPLLHNITLLITLSILYGLVIRSWRKGTFYYSISAGILFSIVAVVGMMNALVLAPGLIFDGRSIIISIASFLGGPVTAIVTVVTTGAYRIWLGGQGMVMGLSVISESALIGLVFFYLDKKFPWVKSNLSMLLFGVLVHTVMLLMMYLLPGGLQAQALSQVAVPVIIIYPLATVVLCLFFIAQEERVVSENLLKENEHKYKALAEGTNSVILKWRPDGILTYINRYGLDLFGYTEDDLLGRHVIGTIVPKVESTGRDLSNMIEEIGESIDGFVSNENENICKDGTRFWIKWRNQFLKNDSGEVAEMLSVGIDITERKQAEEDLQRSKALLRKVLDTVPNYICAKDLDGRFLLVNNELAAFYGTTVDKMTGVLHADMCEDEEELKAMLVADHEVIESGKPQLIPEESMKNPDGSVTYLETIKVPFAIFGDPAVLIMSRDITERKELEEERNKAAKLESIGLLAGGIAHDFNNILTAILGNVSLANILADEDLKKTKAILVEAEKSILSARDLTGQLLTFSKGGEPIKKTIILSDMIKEVTEFSLRGSNVKCWYDIAENLWPCKVDEGQIDQTIRNLVINADQAMSDGGIITVLAGNVTVGPEDSLPLAEGRYVKLTIKDQGLGIPEKHLSKIFDPYFTTKQKGSGIGLATCYSIVKRHDGLIAVESERDIGTTFHTYLPASSELVEAKAERKAYVSEITGKILIMDDEPALVEVVSKILEQIGCVAEAASDGAEAVRLYKKAMKSGQPFNAVILDLTVPGGMGGQETIKKLLEIDPEVKAIVSSGYSNDPVLANFREYGFSSVVTKPYRIDELQEVLQGVMQGKGG